VVIHSAYLPHEEADRIESAVRRGIAAHAATRVGSVDITPVHLDNRIIEVSFLIPSLEEYRTLKFRKDEQSSAEIEWRVRERLSDL
jgi:hypothetical protein